MCKTLFDLNKPFSHSKDPSPLIRVEGLKAGYKDQTILENIHFCVYPGEILVILGGSGCGKSTLLKHMIGLYKPLAGRVLLWNTDLHDADDRIREQILRRVGVLFQSGALFSSMTLAENVALPLQEYSSLTQEEIDLVVRIKLQMVELLGYESRYPSELSGGMRKRAALARAMALDPEILFVDEPSAGLDPVTSADLDALLLQVNAAFGTTLIVVSHELASIQAIGRRAIMLDRSSRGIIAEGEPGFLKDHHPDPRVRAFFHREPTLRRR